MIIRAKPRSHVPQPEPDKPLAADTVVPDVAFDVKCYFTRKDGEESAVGTATGRITDVGSQEEPDWRVRDRMKTVSVAIVVCLNVGVDPPDVIKTSPCARLECWIDPLSLDPQKALDQIGRTLQLQYERWQPKALYKCELDPTTEKVKKLCVTMRRKANEERVLFHYNGHGVPRPTPNGEIWVFNKNYTQYIPLSVYDVLAWVSTPAIYVVDCSNAGQVLKAIQHRGQHTTATGSASETHGVGNGSRSHEILLLAACGPNELLPMNPDYPADLFTTCLTSPIKMALRWFISTHSLIAKSGGITPALLERIPGSLTDRKTPAGELNWIFTAVTDTIAWNVLPRKQFQRLFRQDLLVASLFRNFLLAERILRSVGVTPCSLPRLPPTYNHPMWHAWDFAADLCLAQLPRLQQQPSSFRPSTFFQEQLTAFEVWLDFGSEKRTQPEQLPIVLQVLLSQTHRLRALQLLGRFLDMGSWATVHALSVGIFPYVLRLLQSPASDLRYILVFIWTKLLAFDPSCQIDLIKDHGQHYFLRVLSTPDSANGTEQDDRPCGRVIACFVLSALCRGNHRTGQRAALAGGLLRICLSLLADPCADQTPILQHWLCLCVSECCDNFDAARLEALCDFVPGLTETGQSDSAMASDLPHALQRLLTARSIEVRSSAIHAMGRLFGGSGLTAAWCVQSKSSSGTEPDSPDSNCSLQLDSERHVKLGVRADGAIVLARRPLQVEFAASTSSPAKSGLPKSGECVLPGSRLLSLNGQPVRGCTLDDAYALVQCASAPVVLTFEKSFEANEWAKKEVALAYFVIHSMSDASPVVRLELCNALARFVEHHREEFLRYVTLDGCSPPRVSDSEPGWAYSTFADIWSCVQTLRRDAVPAVASRAAMIHAYISILRPSSSTAPSSAGEIMSSVKKDVHKFQLEGSSAGTSPILKNDRSVRSQHEDGRQTQHSGSALDARHAQVSRLQRLGIDHQSQLPAQDASAFFDDMTPEQQHELLSVVAEALEQNSLDRIQDSYALSDEILGFLVAQCKHSKEETPARGNLVDSVVLKKSHSMMAFGTSANASRVQNSAVLAHENASTESVPKATVTPQGDSARWLEKFNSVLYEESAARFSQPLLRENRREPDPRLEQRRRWRFRRSQEQRHAGGGAGGSVSGTIRRSLEDEAAEMTSFDHQLPSLNNDTKTEGTSRILFHPSEPLLIAADEGNEISVWNYKQGQKVAAFGNHNPASSRITSLGLVNEHDKALLLVGNDDGTVRLWADCQHPDDIDLRSGWNALSGLESGRRGPGLIVHWRQMDGVLVAAGDTDTIRIWDMSHELARQDLVTSSSVTCMAAVPSMPNLFAAGRVDGRIHLYDVRVQAQSEGRSVMQLLDGQDVEGVAHPEWIVNIVAMCQQPATQLLSGSGAGDIKLWDIRRATDGPIRTIHTGATDMSALAAHPRASIIASGSCAQELRIFHFERDVELATIRYHGGWLRQRIGPVTCVAFHPNALVLAAGATDNLVSMYRPLHA